MWAYLLYSGQIRKKRLSKHKGERHSKHKGSAEDEWNWASSSIKISEKTVSQSRRFSTYYCYHGCKINNILFRFHHFLKIKPLIEIKKKTKMKKWFSEQGIIELHNGYAFIYFIKNYLKRSTFMNVFLRPKDGH